MDTLVDMAVDTDTVVVMVVTGMVDITDNSVTNDSRYQINYNSETFPRFSSVSKQPIHSLCYM
jgi:hypothetical protein